MKTNVMIHACRERKWYIDEFLIPALQEQGIEPDVYMDEDSKGNLASTLDCFSKLPSTGSTWHLQDDVIICSDFCERIKRIRSDFCCGFCSDQYDVLSGGIVNPKTMWYSFQCIQIPNQYARQFVSWVSKKYANNDSKYWLQITNNMYDDYLFKAFMKEQYPNKQILNVVPNLVNHIDYLIGGSILSSNSISRVSAYWNEPELIDDLRCKLAMRINV